MKIAIGVISNVSIIVLLYFFLIEPRIEEQEKLVQNLNNNPGETVSVTEFGAKGDGVTDDTEAIRSALEYSLLNNKGLRIPAGKYIITDLISVTGNGYFSIMGEGAETSLLYFSGPEAGISINFSDWHEGNVDVSGLGLNANFKGVLSNPLISVSYMNMTNKSYNYKGPTFKNISSYAVKDSELKSVIEINNAPHTVFDDIYLTGNAYKGTGIHVRGESISTKYVNMWIHTFETGVLISDASEGGEFLGCNFVGNIDGLVYDTKETEPGGTVIGSHFNNTRYNIYANNRNSVFVTETLFFATPDRKSDSTDIYITGKSSFWNISNNTFTTGNEPNFEEKGIEIVSGSLFTISNNIFKQRDTAITIGEGVSDSRILDNNTRGLLNQIVNYSFDEAIKIRTGD